MSSLKLKHSGGNSVSLNPPTSAPTSSDVAFKLPNADGSANQLLKTDGSGQLSFASNVNIDTSGNLLVGNTSYNAGAFGGNSRGINVAGIQPQVLLHETDTDKDAFIGMSASQFFVHTADNIPIRFGIGDSEIARFRSPGGGLMIGETGGTRIGEPKLHVLSGGSGNNIASFFFNTTDDRDAVLIRHNGADGGNNRKMIALLNADGNAVGNIISNGSSTSYNTSSDYRLKENAVAISDGITRLKTLKPYRFNFKLNPTQTVDGFFAHEVTAVPEAIYGEKDGSNMQQIDQSKLVPLLTAALQEEIGKREALEARVAALEAA